jgi:hypothetical protein
MSNVEINLQAYLQAMEDRVVNRIDDVHDTVKELTPRIQQLELQQARTKWLWRMVVALLTAGISQVTYAFFQ